MFHVYLTLAYIFPNVYLYFRIRKLFIPRGFRIWYTLIYIALLSVYPLAENYAHREVTFFSQVLSAISGYILPFYLYLFLLVLLNDILLLLNHFFRLVPGVITGNRLYRLYAPFVILLAAASVVIAGAINLNTIRISPYQIEVSKRQAKTDHLRIAFISDFHIQPGMPLRFIGQYLRKVNALQPDLVLYGGDMTEGDRENETFESVESALRNVQAKLGVFGVAGNHEFYGGRGNSDFFRNSGITLLCDTVIRIDSSCYLAGRYDEHFRRRKSIGELMDSIPVDLPVIVLDHRPTQLQEVSITKAAVQFSGHTHNGQMFPINLITRQFYELTWGYKKIRDTHFFVSSGIRLWGPPVRTVGKSEIMLVDIHFK